MTTDITLKFVNVWYWLFRPKKYVPNKFSWVDENEPESKTKLYKYPHVSMMLDVANIGDFVWHNLTYPESLSFHMRHMMKQQLQLVNLRQLKIRVFEFISQVCVNPTRPLISRRVPGLSMGATKLEDIKFSRPCVRVFTLGNSAKTVVLAFRFIHYKF